MSGPLTVELDARLPSMARGLVASLGRSLRVSAGGRPDIMIVDGSTNWARRAEAAVDRGIARILVLEPVLDDMSAMLRLADRIEGGETTLFLSEGFGGNPALAPFRDWLDERFGILSLSGHGTGPLAAQLLIQLRILRALGVEAPPALAVLVSDAGFLATERGRRNDRDLLIRLRSTRSAATSPRQAVAAYGAQASARLELFDGVNARPAEALIATEHGLCGLPSIHENAHRNRLRLLARSGVVDRAELRNFIRDAERATFALR